ncbi:MAG: hypothetical protein AABM67_10075 [Acidobacteriota bacterium]
MTLNQIPTGDPKALREKLSILSIGMVVAAALLLSGCGNGSGSSGLQVKSPNTGEKDLAIKSSYSYAVTKSFTDTSNNITTAPSYRVYSANYDLDSANFGMTLDKPLTSDDHIRLVFSLVGEQGGTEKTPPKAGTYSAKADKFMKVEEVSIVSRKGANDSKVVLDRNTLSGEVKVTSASSTAISGDVNLSAGEIMVKGSFTAKILTRK